MTYTLEQEDIFSTCLQMQTNEIVSIIAPAGGGKTFVLSELAKQMPKEKILYLAYNKAIKQEAKNKFPKNTQIETVHSLAYSCLKLNDKVVREKDYTVLDISEMFDIDFETANFALISFNEFCNSNKKGFTRKEYNEKQEIKIAYELFKKMKNREIQITHSFYLKEFELIVSDKPNLFDFTVILLDEAQDSNEVTLSIFNSFFAKKIFVGDPNQAIYSFRNCVNAFDIVKCNYQLRITDCYRCSANILERANFLLQHFKHIDYKIKSKQKENIPSAPTKAVITRTNAKIIELISKQSDKNYVLLKNPNDIFKNSIVFVNFLKNRKEKIDYNNFVFLKKCKNEQQLKEYIEQSGSIELKSAFRIAKIYGDRIFKLYRIAKENYNKKKSLENIYYLTTAHTSKGLEFDCVELTNDFPDLFSLLEQKINNEECNTNIIEEINLYYVAITRAKFILDDTTKTGQEIDSLDI